MTETNNRTSMGWIGGGSSSKTTEIPQENIEENNVNREQEDNNGKVENE